MSVCPMFQKSVTPTTAPQLVQFTDMSLNREPLGSKTCVSNVLLSHFGHVGTAICIYLPRAA